MADNQWESPKVNETWMLQNILGDENGLLEMVGENGENKEQEDTGEEVDKCDLLSTLSPLSCSSINQQTSLPLGSTQESFLLDEMKGEGMVMEDDGDNFLFTPFAQNLLGPTDLQSSQTLELLESRALEMGLHIKRDTSIQQGDCQFAAIAHQLMLRIGGYHTADSVRKDVVEWLGMNCTWRIGDSTVGEFMGQMRGSVENYLGGMGKGQTWGDHLTLLAACWRYQVTILVISSAPTNWELRYGQGEHLLTLGHMLELHYFSLVPASREPNVTPQLSPENNLEDMGIFHNNIQQNYDDNNSNYLLSSSQQTYPTDSTLPLPPIDPNGEGSLKRRDREEAMNYQDEYLPAEKKQKKSPFLNNLEQVAARHDVENDGVERVFIKLDPEGLVHDSIVIFDEEKAKQSLKVKKKSKESAYEKIFPKEHYKKIKDETVTEVTYGANLDKKATFEEYKTHHQKLIKNLTIFYHEDAHVEQNGDFFEKKSVDTAFADLRDIFGYQSIYQLVFHGVTHYFHGMIGSAAAENILVENRKFLQQNHWIPKQIPTVLFLVRLSTSRKNYLVLTHEAKNAIGFTHYLIPYSISQGVMSFTHNISHLQVPQKVVYNNLTTLLVHYFRNDDCVGKAVQRDKYRVVKVITGPKKPSDYLNLQPVTTVVNDQDDSTSPMETLELGLTKLRVSNHELVQPLPTTQTTQTTLMKEFKVIDPTYQINPPLHTFIAVDIGATAEDIMAQLKKEVQKAFSTEKTFLLCTHNSTMLSPTINIKNILHNETELKVLWTC